MSDFSEQIDRDFGMGWDDEIENEGNFTVVPDGDYDFVVKAFERGLYEPKEGSKIPQCNKATLSIEISNAAGEKTTIEHRLYLCKSQEWKLSDFFIAIGQKKHGEPLRPVWNSVTGSRGKCKVGKREYNGNTFNEIKKFYDPAGSGSASRPAAFTPGNF